MSIARNGLGFDPGETPYNYNSGSSLVQKDVIVADGFPAKLRSIVATQASGSTQYLLLFDQKTTPVNTNVAVAVIALPTGATTSLDFGAADRRGGMTFNNGIAYGISSTFPALTLVTASSFVQALFE